jgi:hypothetical protein
VTIALVLIITAALVTNLLLTAYAQEKRVVTGYVGVSPSLAGLEKQ